MSSFDKAFGVVLGHEGGYVNHPRDPGGETKWGISKRAYPREDIKNLTVERAKELYKRDYWDACRCGEMPASVGLIVFDAAVNCGVSRSTKWLQQSVGAAADGFIGPATMAALQKALAGKGRATVCRDLLTARLTFQVALPTWKTFGLGWARRIVSLPFAAALVEQEGESHGGH